MVKSTYCFIMRTRVRNHSTHIKQLQFWLLWMDTHTHRDYDNDKQILKRLNVMLGMVVHTCDPKT